MEIRERLKRAREAIDRAAMSVGRDPSSVKLIVVTKTQPLEVIRAALEAGTIMLGENYAEEAIEKIRSIHAPIEWHMIGHIQSRKADLVAPNFHMAHSVDSLKLATRLDRFAREAGKRLPVLLECNVSGEESKFGYDASAENKWSALIAEFSQIASLPNLHLRGLMTMPPYSDDPEAARPAFVKLKRLQSFLQNNIPSVEWADLSMGTSVDYLTAVQEGATYVRIGTAILGERKV